MLNHILTNNSMTPRFDEGLVLRTSPVVSLYRGKSQLRKPNSDIHSTES